MNDQAVREWRKTEQKVQAMQSGTCFYDSFLYECRERPDLQIPYYYFRGRDRSDSDPGKKRPLIWIQAGLHGDEYDGILAIRKLTEKLTDLTLYGDVILIPVLNISAYEAQANASPLDSVNLNRVFARGESKDSFTWNYGRFLLDLIMQGTDYFVDLHGGGQYLDVEPFISISGTPSPHDREILELAEGLDITCICRNQIPGMLIERLSEEGMPALLLERGGGLVCQKDAVDGHMQNVLRILQFWGFLKESEQLPAKDTRKKEKIEESLHLYFDHAGIQVENCQVGTEVLRGDPLLHWMPLEQKPECVISCPAEKGVILSIHTSARISKGDYAVMIGLI